MDTPTRTVRVFLSSTFRDFAEERDLLVRKVFPELRRKCRERQVELVEVDLRWGITAEEAEQGKVLPICLGEIDRARPYFMGFIGDRYGWVPEGSEYPEVVVEREPWLEEHQGGKSVTELEMLHGVLNNPEMAGRAFFYYRDTEYSKAKGGDYAAESPEHAAKLEDLKERIRASKFPVEEDYPDPEALAELVRRDLQALIEEEYPEEEVPDALTLERMRHEAYGAARRRLYLGGEEYFEKLDRAAARDGDESRPVLVTAEAGLGKSALLSNWLQHWREDHPKPLVFLHHLSASSEATDPVRLIRRLMGEVSAVTGEELKPEDDPEKVLEQLPAVLATMSNYAIREEREWLVVLDGLDKVNGHEHLRWFPRTVPEGLKLVVSCTRGSMEETLRPLLDWERVELEPFSEARCREFIGTYLSDFRKTLPEELVARILGHPLSNRPLWLLTLLEELRLFGVHEELEARLMTVLSDPPGKEAGEAPTIDDLYEHVLARIEVDIEGDYEVEAFKAIWASFDGLARNELLELTGMPPAKWAEIQTALDENLFESGGQITFGNQFIRKAVEDMHLPGDEEKRSAHRWLGEWFDKRELTLDVAQERVHQWKETGDCDRLRSCLLEQDVFRELHRNDEYALLAHWVQLGGDVGEAYQNVYDQWPDKEELMEILANFLKLAGSYGAFTETLYRRVLEGEERVLGPDHPTTLKSVNSLGILLYDKGDYEGAEKLYRRALGGQEKELGPDHPDTLSSVNSLGILLANKGDYEGAEKLYRRALEGRERVLGPDHPETLKSVNNLGILLKDKGDYEGVEKLYRRALEGKERVLGPDHPSTLMSVNNLGILLKDKGDYEGAEKLYRRALEGRERVLGPDHPETLKSVNSLGILLKDKGDYEGAEKLYRRALEGQERVLGPDHPSTLNSVNSLGILLDHEGDFEGAEKLFRQALEGRDQVLGTDHPDTLRSVNNLGIFLNEQSRRPEAINLLRSYASRSAEAEDTLAYNLAYNLACYECLEGNHDEARRLIGEHLAKHPEMKDQALADEDFAAIREWIKTSA
ncbi:tetratricopeptide repeat protein [Verrucomicrobiales bacterium]|nr:tetratricopeptide repeat protein [Verrucomicrobiales bacterium]